MMASNGGSVEEVLRARAAARRIKEHYTGTLGVYTGPGLKGLGHLLAHDKEEVFSNLELAPEYRKTAPPPEPEPNHEAPQNHRHRQHSHTSTLRPHSPHHTTVVSSGGASASATASSLSPAARNRPGSARGPSAGLSALELAWGGAGSGNTSGEIQPQLRRLSSAVERPVTPPLVSFMSPIAAMDPRNWITGERAAAAGGSPAGSAAHGDGCGGGASGGGSLGSGGGNGLAQAASAEASTGSVGALRAALRGAAGGAGSFSFSARSGGAGGGNDHGSDVASVSGRSGGSRGSRGGAGSSARVREGGSAVGSAVEAAWGEEEPEAAAGTAVRGEGDGYGDEAWRGQQREEEEEEEDGYVREDEGGDDGGDGGDGGDGTDFACEPGEATLAPGSYAFGGDGAEDAATAARGSNGVGGGGSAAGSVAAARSRWIASQSATPMSGLSTGPSGQDMAASGAGTPRSESESRSENGSDSGSDADLEQRKHRLAGQMLLAPGDLAPEEWARIGPPKDAADAGQFIARGYTIEVDLEPHTYTTKRVARPDIFHISKQEVARRRAVKEEAAFALQAQRRAAQEEEEYEAERLRQRISTPRGPRYDEFGVLLPDRPKSPVRPRYLDWHPHAVGGLAHQQRLQDAAAAERRRRPGDGLDSTGTSPVASRGVSAAASRARSASASHGLGASVHAHLPPSRFHAEPSLGQDGFVYEDNSEGAHSGDDVVGRTRYPCDGAAAGTSRPISRRQRVQSAMAGRRSYTPVTKPPDVSAGHYAQMLREQRKWLNAPVQPPRPATAAAAVPPPTASQHYVRPRSSRPAPDGTAPPVPSRVAAAAAATAAAKAAAARPSSALRTVLHPREEPSPYASSAAACGSRSRPQSAAAGRPLSGGGGWASSSRPQSAASKHQLLPWESKEHTVVTVGGGAAQRPYSAGSRTYAGGGGGSAAAPLAKEPSVYGETLPPEGAPEGAQGFTPRKFVMHDNMLDVMIDGYHKR